jgi:hypothetical protein
VQSVPEGPVADGSRRAREELDASVAGRIWSRRLGRPRRAGREVAPPGEVKPGGRMGDQSTVGVGNRFYAVTTDEVGLMYASFGFTC